MTDYGPVFQATLLKALARDPSLFSAASSVAKVSDFESVPVRFVYEVLQWHFSKFGSLPSCEVFQDEMSEAVDASMNGEDSESVPMTEISESDMGELSSVVDGVSEGLCDPSDEDSPYWKEKLKEYLAAARISGIVGEDMTAMEQVKEVEKINAALSTLDATDGDSVMKGEDMGVFEEAEADNRIRIGTGVWGLDRRTAGGGLAKGQLGIVVAPSGKGKTTFMINFAANMSLMGYYTLFISLEMGPKEIFKRYTAILGNFDATLLHTPPAKWPADALERAKLVSGKKSPFYGRFEIVDGRKKLFTVPMIEAAVKSWKERLQEDGVPEDRIAAVFVDYLGKMDASGLSGINKNSGTYDQERKIMDAFDGLATRQDIILWTATQTNREGFGRAQQSMKNISNSIGAVFPSYLAIGIGEPPSEAASDVPTYEFEVETKNKTNTLTRVDRKLVITIMKSRDSQTEGQFFTVYQGPTLRLWTNRQQATTAMDIASRMSMDELYTALMPVVQTQ